MSKRKTKKASKAAADTLLLFTADCTNDDSGASHDAGDTITEVEAADTYGRAIVDNWLEIGVLVEVEDEPEPETATVHIQNIGKDEAMGFDAEAEDDN